MRSFRLNETIGLLASWLVISICFSIGAAFSYPEFFYLIFALSAASAGLGFILHELAHRSVARRYGCHAYYQIWPMGLVLALVVSILTRGSFIFAALGAVYITPMLAASTLDYNALKRVFGMISLSGPAMNLLLVAFFYTIQPFGGYISLLASYGMSINLWLAAFNLIPVPPFDGSKIFAWSKVTWALFAVPAWILVLIL